jgi:hypothetical protein
MVADYLEGKPESVVGDALKSLLVPAKGDPRLYVQASKFGSLKDLEKGCADRPDRPVPFNRQLLSFFSTFRQFCAGIGMSVLFLPI